MAEWVRNYNGREIAKEQLDLAIALFCEGKHYIAAVTLAGAADGILDGIVRRLGKDPAIIRNVDESLKIYQQFFDEPGNRSIFLRLENFARNSLKHSQTNKTFELDIEQSAVDMIERAIRNWRIFDPDSFQPTFNEFDRAAAVWAQRREHEILGAQPDR